MDQRTKVFRAHEQVCARYTKDKVFGKGAIAVAFFIEEEEGGYKVTEIFRNIDAAEAYYDHFMKDKMLPMIALTNLYPCWPMRQKAGPDAAVSDGNVKAWVTNPARLAEGPQTIKYNHLKIESNPGGKVEVVEWATAPTPAELEKQFGKLHFGFRSKPSLAPTDTSDAGPSVDASAVGEAAPKQEEMK